MNVPTRRGLLAAAGALATATGVNIAAIASSGAAPGVSPAAKMPEPELSGADFKHPSEYLAAMTAIGWQPVAMFQRLEGGGVHRMGVAENEPSEKHLQNNWIKFHAICMRAPVDTQHSDWWKQVWQYLYDKGLREDVTPRKLAARLAAEGSAS